MCQGQLEVQVNDIWHTVDSRSWGRNPDRWKDPKQASKFCQKLNCGEALDLGHFLYFNRLHNHFICYGPLWSFSSCNASNANQRDPLSLICLGE